jgi:hypothetical protein
MKILNPNRTDDLEYVSYIVVTHTIHFTFTSLCRKLYIQLLETGLNQWTAAAGLWCYREWVPASQQSRQTLGCEEIAMLCSAARCANNSTTKRQ